MTGMDQPTDVGLSPDQKFVYVLTNVGFGDSALARFERNAGSVSFAGAQSTADTFGAVGRFLRIPTGGQHLYALDNFIIGGGAHTRVLPGWIHAALALIALGMNIATCVLALQSIAENVVLIDELDEVLPENAGD